MIKHNNISDAALWRKIYSGNIIYAGWITGKIFGKLNCASGQHKIKRENRIFFESHESPTNLGYRPCAKCMPSAYKKWKETQTPSSK